MSMGSVGQECRFCDREAVRVMTVQVKGKTKPGPAVCGARACEARAVQAAR